MKFSEYIAYKRKEKKMSIRQLALYSEISPGYISQIESENRGTPTPDVIKKLAKGLKTPYKELMEVAGYIDVDNDSDKQDEKTAIMNKIAEDFPDADLMFHDLANMDAEQLQEVYEFIKFKSQQNK